MPNSNINYAMWLGGTYDCLAADNNVKKIQDAFYAWLDKNPLEPVPMAAADEDAPANRARETIKDLKAGTVPQSIVRDLGDAVKQATRDSGVGRAIGGSDRMVGGLAR